MSAHGAYGCVFCTRQDQPPPLFETAGLYAMPDRFPLVPGHTLIIAQRHMRCYGAASPRLLRELDAVATRVRRFLEDAYGAPVLINETGGAGQTVAHAHLHLSPMPNLIIPPPVLEHTDVQPIRAWGQVRAYFTQHGRYYYVAWGERRYVLPSSDSPVLETLRRLVATAIGVPIGEQGLGRAASSEDVSIVGQRRRTWTQGRLRSGR